MREEVETIRKGSPGKISTCLFMILNTFKTLIKIIIFLRVLCIFMTDVFLKVGASCLGDRGADMPGESIKQTEIKSTIRRDLLSRDFPVTLSNLWLSMSRPSKKF